MAAEARRTLARGTATSPRPAKMSAPIQTHLETPIMRFSGTAMMSPICVTRRAAEPTLVLAAARDAERLGHAANSTSRLPARCGGGDGWQPCGCRQHGGRDLDGDASQRSGGAQWAQKRAATRARAEEAARRIAKRHSQ